MVADGIVDGAERKETHDFRGEMRAGLRELRTELRTDIRDLRRDHDRNGRLGRPHCASGPLDLISRGGRCLSRSVPVRLEQFCQFLGRLLGALDQLHLIVGNRLRLDQRLLVVRAE
jgi:hypothetical protein